PCFFVEETSRRASATTHHNARRSPTDRETIHGRARSSSAKHFILPEPRLHPAPGVLGGFLAVTRAIVGVEAMRRTGIDLELGGLVGLRKRRLQCFDIGNGNA